MSIAEGGQKSSGARLVPGEGKVPTGCNRRSPGPCVKAARGLVGTAICRPAAQIMPGAVMNSVVVGRGTPRPQTIVPWGNARLMVWPEGHIG